MADIAHAHPLTIPPDRTLPYMMLVIGIVVGGTAPILVRLAQGEGVPSLMIAFARLAVAALFLTPFVLNRHRTQLRQLTRSDLALTALAGAMLAGHFITLFVAFENTSILIAGVLSGSSPLWVALMEVFFLKTRLSRMVWLGLVVALSGGAAIGLGGFNGSPGIGQDPLLGGVLAFISALLIGVYLIAGRRVRTHMPLFLFIWLVFSFAALTMLVAVIATGTPVIGYSLDAYLYLLLLILGAQLIAQSAFNYALAYLSATFISISGQVVTVVASTGAFLIFAEVPRPLQLVGSAVLVVGVILASGSHHRPNPVVVPSESPGK
jgi:drug/metabolite transporter (DMT)-like permease